MSARPSERKSLMDATRGSSPSVKDSSSSKELKEAATGKGGGAAKKSRTPTIALAAILAVIGAIAVFVYLPGDDGLTAEERQALSEPPVQDPAPTEPTQPTAPTSEPYGEQGPPPVPA